MTSSIRGATHQMIRITSSPYHVGIHNHRVGNGPNFLLYKGLRDTLAASGLQINVSDIESVYDFEGEIGRSFEVIRRVSNSVTTGLAHGDFPLLLAGNCNNEVGMVAAFEDQDFELIWFDAHADYDTPSEAVSGYFDGEGVSMLTGECWHALMKTVPGHRDIDKNKVIFCGVRDMSEGQKAKLKQSGIRAVVGGKDTPQGSYAKRLKEELAKSTKEKCIVHVDVDSLDTSIGIANKYAAPGGLLAQDLYDCLEVISQERKVIGMTIASFDPGFGGADALAEVVIRATNQLLASQLLGRSNTEGATKGAAPLDDINRKGAINL